MWNDIDKKRFSRKFDKALGNPKGRILFGIKVLTNLIRHTKAVDVDIDNGIIIFHALDPKTGKMKVFTLS